MNNPNVWCPAIFKTNMALFEEHWFRVFDCLNFPKESHANGDYPSYTVDLLEGPRQDPPSITDKIYGLSFRRDSNFNLALEFFLVEFQC